MRFLLILLLLVAWPDDGEKNGRAGNAHYQEERYEQAADAYREGLGLLPADARTPVQYGLLNNLGAALFAQGDYAGAQAAFRQALAQAPLAADVSRTAYNSGNTSYRQQEMEAATEAYRQALLADPTNEAARYNYELARRQMEEQQQSQQGGEGSNDPNDQEQEEQAPGESDEQQEGQQQGQQPEAQEPQGQQDGQQPNTEGQQQPQPPAPNQQPQDPTELSRAQAERILEALEQDEERLLREVQKIDARPRRVEKDW